MSAISICIRYSGAFDIFDIFDILGTPLKKKKKKPVHWYYRHPYYDV